ncbi:hypothetical protein VTO73DRAFT_1991 [Trametes versicolor]
MSSDSDTISHFTPLDELIQVIYQGSSRFVIISSVDDANWTVHVGITGDDGRWWQGRWTEKDVREVIGSKLSGFLVDSFVEKLADTFTKGELSIGGWSSDRTAPLQLVFGTQAKTPISIALNELPLRDAVVYATKVFAEPKRYRSFLQIALQAQSRGCRLYPSTIDLPSLAPATSTSGLSKTRNRRSPEVAPATETRHHTSHNAKGKEKASGVTPAPDNRYKRKADEAEEEIQALKAELEKTKRQQNALMTDPAKLYSKNKPAPAASKVRGVSLANPTKKARKYKPLEFESDDDA